MLPHRCNIFFSTLCDLIRELTKYGFYHKYDDKIRDWSLKFREVREIAGVLLYAVDGRTDVRSFEGAERGAHLESSTNNLIVIEGKVKVLEQLIAFFQCCDNERITDLLQFWEHFLQNNNDSNSAVRDSQAQKALNDWSNKPPWTPSDIKTLANRLFGAEYNILPSGARKDLSNRMQSSLLLRAASSMTNLRTAPEPVGNRFTATPSLDEWTRIMLYLIRYPSQKLKHLTFKGLVINFKQHSHFITAALSTQIVYTTPCKSIVRAYHIMLDQSSVCMPKDHAKYLAKAYVKSSSKLLAAAACPNSLPKQLGKTSCFLVKYRVLR